MAFHPYPQVIAAVFNRRAFGPPRGLTPASACPRIAHPASRPRRGTQVALLRLAFAPAPFRLTSPRASDSLAHSTKGTPSQHKVAPTARGRTVSGTVSLPSRGAFHLSLTYWCAIGHRVVLRLGWWSTQVRTGFHVPGPTQGPRRAVRSGFAYGAVTRCGRPSHAVPLPSRTCARGRQPPDARPCNPVGGTPAGYARSTVWPSVPFRSPLLGESRD